jgi:hypothetical protein
VSDDPFFGQARYPLLRQLFNGNDAAYRNIEVGDSIGIERQRAESLLRGARSLPIVGLDKLVVDASQNLSKFVNVLAEVRFAILLARKGMRVEVLRDQAFGAVDGMKTPDLRVSLPNGFEALVEVTRCSGWWPKLSENLDAAISKAGMGVRVEDVIGGKLGGSVPDWRGRTENDALCERVAREVVEGLEEASRSGSVYGTVHVFSSGSTLRHEIEVGRRDKLPLLDETTTGDGDAWLGSFVFEPAELGIAQTGGGVIAAHQIDISSHASRFLRAVKNKALKRQDFPAEYASATPYFVAVQNDEIELPPVAVLSALTGSRAFISVPTEERARWQRDNPVTYPRAVEEADRRWRPLFKEWDYGDDSKYRMTDYGAYLDGAATWASNLSGVWVLHENRSSLLQWLPNPFAAPAINDPRFLELGFSIAQGGAVADAD